MSRSCEISGQACASCPRREARTTIAASPARCAPVCSNEYAGLRAAAPVGVNVEGLARDVARKFTDVRLHHVHAWEVGSGQRMLTAHMKVGATTLLEVEAIAAEVRSSLHEEWGITRATLEAEANGCGREDLLGDWK